MHTMIRSDFCEVLKLSLQTIQFASVLSIKKKLIKEEKPFKTHNIYQI